jgi:6-hydroxynicotinate 3-monooxygenase
MRGRKRIAVIGGGLGGVTVGGFLQRAGFDVKIYEQAPTFSRIGAGIILSANAMKAFRRLQVEDNLLKTGIKPRGYISRAWDTGDTMYEIGFDAQSEARFGGAYLNVHRGDLHAVLQNVVTSGTIAFDHRLVGLEESSESIRLVFDNGVRADFDVVIGADGIHSTVRRSLRGPEPPRFIGAVAYRAIFPTARLGGFRIADCTKWWGPDRHILPYFMTSQRDEVYVIGVVPASSWNREEASIPVSRESFMVAFEGFHCDLQRVLAAADDVSLWPIYDRERDDRWSGGRIVLLGDACHPVRPFMGAGGAMAVEDAAVLCRCLCDFDEPTEAFRWYEANRIPRVAEVQRISIENSWMRGPTETDWFYCYDPCTEPLIAPAPAKHSGKTS